MNHRLFSIRACSVLVVFTLAFNSSISIAQPNVNTLFSISNVRANPAFVGADDDANVAMHNKLTFFAPSKRVIENAIMLDLPLLIGKSGRRFGGIGASLSNQSASDDALKSDHFALASGYNFSPAPNHIVNFALQPMFSQRYFSISGFSTGNQWIAQEFRFDPSLPLGEPVDQYRDSFWVLNAGALWERKDPLGQSKAWVGINIFELPLSNRNEVYSARPGALIQLNSILYKGGNRSVSLLVFGKKNLYLISFGTIQTFSIGFKNDNPFDVIGSGTLNLIAKWEYKAGTSIGLIIDQPSFSFGFSYQTVLSSSLSSRFYDSQLEFGIALKRSMKKKGRSGGTSSLTQAETRRFEFNNQQQVESGSDSSGEVSAIKKRIEEISKVSGNRIQFQLDKHFNFSFGRADLDDEAKAFLDGIYVLLEENPTYMLEVIGHTDNVGKPFANYRLSVARAMAVTDYLHSLGIEKTRLKHAGKGDTEPLGKNDSEQSRARNRRVQLIISVGND